MIIYTNLFGFLKNTGYIGITIFPFIFIGKQYKNRPNLINHERIHFQQQIELLVLPFFILYFGNYLINLFKYRFNHITTSFLRKKLTKMKIISII